mgnify:CR=1 FL=1
MQKQLDSRLTGMETRLAKMIAHLETLEQEKLHHKPDGKWSPAQIFQHLHDSEIGTLSYLEKKINEKKGEVPLGGLGSKLRSFILSRALRNKKKKYRAPKVLGEPGEKPNFEFLKTDYLEARRKLRTLLSKLEKKDLKKAYFKHPVAGRLTIVQTLGFLEDHFERHFEQIKERSK